MNIRRLAILAGALAMSTLHLMQSQPAQAHFLWMVGEPAERPTAVKVYFSETASPDDPALLDRVAKAEVWVAGSRRSEPQAVELKREGDALQASLPAGTSTPVLLRHTYGVITRGGQTFLLKYYAKTYPSSLPGTWQAVQDKERAPLEIVPAPSNGQAMIGVLWQGQPLAGAAVTIEGPGLDGKLEGTTNEQGYFQGALNQAGVYSVRVRHSEKTPGEHEGQAYDEVRHYATLALPFSPVQMHSVAHRWPDLARGTTSFGGAVDGDWLYVYGGHYGQPHHYSTDGQSGDFQRLNLRSPGEWESLAGGPKLTGLAAVAHEGRVYRIGGFTAKNSEKEEESLWSQDDVAVFNAESKQWESAPALPRGRSSHDAAVLDGKLYVVGGWQMQAGQPTQWHSDALALDLASDNPQWKPIAEPPFRRRALALAAWNGKLYAIGGMQEKGGPTTAVAVYDPAEDKWSEGPALLGGAMDGFGSSSFATGGRLFVTTMSGSVQRLAEDGSKWEFVGQLEQPRFFHRILPFQNELVVVGGASMSVGKIESLERIALKSEASGSTPTTAVSTGGE